MSKTCNHGNVIDPASGLHCLHCMAASAPRGNTLRVYVDDMTLSILGEVARRTGRSIEDLAESAIAEEAIRSLPPQVR